MKPIYRVCCYDEILGLLEGYAIVNDRKHDFGFSFTKNLSYANQLYRQGKRFKSENENMSNWLVTYDLDLLDNHIEVIYDLGWFMMNPTVANHVFATDIDLSKLPAAALYQFKESIETNYSLEEEIFVETFRMEEGLILEIKTNNPLVNKLKNYYYKYWTTPVNFVKE
jgi:hypothetical protein